MTVLAEPSHSPPHARRPRGSEPRDASIPRERLLFVTLAVLLVFVALTLLLAATRPPQSDEGIFANAGASLASRGRFVMPMATPWISTLDRHVYSNMPLYFLALGGWFRAFGVSWMALRALSVLFGVVLVVALLASLRSISRDRGVYLAGLVLVALNYDLMNLSSARYDVMTAALSAAGIAAYLHLRERSLDRALLVANALLAAACLTHPYALFGMVGLASFVAFLDLRALRLRHLGIVAAPYLVALAAWGLYIAQDPALFRAQLAENAKGRFDGARSPLAMIGAEIRERYLGRFAGWRPGVPAAMRVRTLWLLAYLAGVVGCLVIPRLRANRAVRALVTYAILAVLLLMVADSYRWYVYLVHVLPPLALCLALVVNELSRQGRRWRLAVNAGLAASALFSVATVAYRARVDVHHRALLPTVDFLRSHLRDGDLVMAGGEFGIGLGFEQHVLDDPALGYRNQRVPEYIVLGAERRATLEASMAANPSFRKYAESLLSTYTPVFEASAGSERYTVLARRPRGVALPAAGAARGP